MRTEQLFNDNWEFICLDFGTGLEEAVRIMDSAEILPEDPAVDAVPHGKHFIRKITLPHDWLIYDTLNLYGDGTGWYRKSFSLEKENGMRYLINFDGVYMDSVVYVNNREAGGNHYGYSAFELDITDLLVSGGNTVMVAVNHKSPNSRWYSGAGIFRNVVFKCVPEIHIATDGVYISTRKEDGRWFVFADTEISDDRAEIIVNQTDGSENGKISAGNENNNLGSIAFNSGCEKNNTGISDASVSGYDNYELGFEIRLLPALAENSRCIVKTCPGAEDFVIEDASQGDDCSVCKHPCARRNEVKVADVETTRIELTESAKYAKAAFEFSTVFAIDDAFVWDITSPNLYELTVRLVKRGPDQAESNLPGENVVDEVKIRFGLREAVFTNDKGFFLNGRRVKLNGVCEHHDLGCLGAAFRKDAFRRKIMVLKEMGVNAIRTSHNMPARGLVELADEMGILLDSEAFDMWRRPKTEYDYARFFNEDYAKDVASWVRRDRSNPSVIMWSTGNEIYDCHADESAQDLTRDLKKNVEMHDYRKNGIATFASNYMAWEGAQKCADILKLAGYNYGERLYDAHHAKYPDWMIYGSETCSTVQSRGIYHFPLKVSVMADDDEQCSALGNCTTSWGAENVEYVIKAERDRDYSAGQFLWSGFDYIGEPTPYHTKNSYFGQIDTAGFKKDTYYIFKAEWTDPKKAPFVHLFPYWDFNEGQIIDVRIASNAPCMELIVNGISHGKKYVDHAKDAVLCPVWQVPYHKGYIEAIAYDENGNEIARQRRSSFGDVNEVKSRRTVIGGLVFFEIYALDADGNEVENANSRINVRITNGRLLGLDNGDSTDFDRYKCDSRRMFVGRLLAVAEAAEGHTAEDVGIELEIDNKDVPVRKIEICCLRENDPEGNHDTEIAPEVPENAGDGAESGNDENGKIHAHFTPGHVSETVEARIYPANATYKDITWAVVNDYAVKSNLASIIPGEPECVNEPDSKEADSLLSQSTLDSGNERNSAANSLSHNNGYIRRTAKLTAKGDGQFRLRCMTHNGTDKMQCISTLEFEAAGLGMAYLDPYDFIAGSLYTDSKGDVGNGNEKGVATPRGADSYIGYENIDFGEFGSDEITLPIFTLDANEYEIGIWEGRPGDDGSELLLDGRYCKPSIWNVYQPETYKLKRRVRGITSIYFTAKAKFHIKGFSFTAPDKAFSRVYAIENSRIYGDSFTVGDDAVTGIGNNVTIEFDDTVFGERKAKQLTICGRSVAENNSIHLKLTYSNGESVKTLLEFPHTDDYEEKTFDISASDTTNCIKTEFVFLPGSNFDMRYYMFS